MSQKPIIQFITRVALEDITRYDMQHSNASHQSPSSYEGLETHKDGEKATDSLKF